jgi:hypothetical protein
VNVARTPKPDSIDARRLREMIDSPPYRLVAARVNAELDRALATCERSDVAVTLHRSQGAVAALRTVLAIPELILKEIAKSV